MVLAVGCLDVTLGITFNSDGSGSLEFEVEVSQEFLYEVVESGEFDSGRDELELSREDACNLLMGRSLLRPPFVNVALSGVWFESKTGISADGASCRTIMRVAWAAEHADLIFEDVENGDGPIVRRVSPDGWRIELPMGDEVTEPIFTELDEVTIEVSATLPGNPVEHNADRVSSDCGSSTFSWDVDIAESRGHLVAESDGQDDCGGGGNPGPIVAVVLLGTLVVALGAVVVINRFRRRRANEPSQEMVDHT